MTTTTNLKCIEYSRLDRDYSAWYDGEFIGAYPNYLAAERALDDHALYIIEEGLDRTATELDGGATMIIDQAETGIIDNHGNPVDPYAPLGVCWKCGENAWTTTGAGLLCPDHDDYA